MQFVIIRSFLIDFLEDENYSNEFLKKQSSNVAASQSPLCTKAAAKFNLCRCLFWEGVAFSCSFQASSFELERGPGGEQHAISK